MRGDPLANAIANRYGPSLPVSGSTIANSSPPKRRDDVRFPRAHTNDARRLHQRRLPARCPWVSFTDLKPSRSMKSSDSGRPLRDGALCFPPQHLRQVPRVVELSQVVRDGERLGPLHP